MPLIGSLEENVVTEKLEVIQILGFGSSSNTVDNKYGLIMCSGVDVVVNRDLVDGEDQTEEFRDLIERYKPMK